MESLKGVAPKTVDRWHGRHGYAVLRFGNINRIWSMTGVYPFAYTSATPLFSSHSPKISKGLSTSSTPTLLVLHSEMQWTALWGHDYVQLFRRPGRSYVNDRFAFSFEVQRTKGAKSMQLDLNEVLSCLSLSLPTFAHEGQASRGPNSIWLLRSCTSTIYTCQVPRPEMEHCVQQHSTLQCADEKPAFCNQDVFLPFEKGLYYYLYSNC